MATKRQKNEYERLCSTKAGRADVTQQIVALAERHGATVLEHDEHLEDRETYLRLAIGPYRVSMHLEGNGCPGAFLGHWHMDTSSEATYPTSFGVTIRGGLNTFHYRKATTCEETISGFLGSLERGFQVLDR
jgi:hypothetical protein